MSQHIRQIWDGGACLHYYPIIIVTVIITQFQIRIFILNLDLVLVLFEKIENRRVMDFNWSA